jgi:hypothetical protein
MQSTETHRQEEEGRTTKQKVRDIRVIDVLQKVHASDQIQAAPWILTSNMSTQGLPRLLSRILQGTSIQCTNAGLLPSGLRSALRCGGSGCQRWQPAQICSSQEAVIWQTQLTFSRSFASSTTEQEAKSQHQLQAAPAAPDMAEGSRCRQTTDAMQPLAKVRCSGMGAFFTGAWRHSGTLLGLSMTVH